MTLYVDTSVWYAAVNGRDRWHQQARELLSRGEQLVTSDHVLVETWLLVNRRIHRSAAEQFWEGMRDGVGRIEVVAEADMEAAWAIARLFPDQAFSLIDRTSFALMERLGLTRAASFDGQFATYRYGRSLSRAFEVVR